MPQRRTKSKAQQSVRKPAQKKLTKKDAACRNFAKNFEIEIDDVLRRSRNETEERAKGIELAGEKIASSIPEKWANVTVEDFIKFGGDYPITSIIQLGSSDMNEILLESLGRLDKNLKTA